MEPQKEQYTDYLSYPLQSNQTNDEIDLLELMKAIWKGKWIIFISITIFAIGSVIYALSLPNIYKSDALLAPTESSSGGGLAKMAGQLGGLAALAGVNLQSGETSQTDLAVQVMKSRDFIVSFINSHDLWVPLMAAKGWSLTEDKLILNKELYNPENGKWLRKPQGLRGSKPTEQEAYQVFSTDVFGIEQEKDSGLYIVSVKHYSPYIAQQWVNWLVEDINKVMRERTIAETSQNLAYLNAQLKKTSVTDMQSTFYKLIEEQTKSLMLAEVQDEFIFKTIDPSVVPEIKTSPKRALICVLGGVLGGGFGLTIVLVMYIVRKNIRND